MKKLFTLFFSCFILLTGNSQVLFYEDFDGIAGPTAGGAGTYTFPTGWFLSNVDNLTPASTVSYVNEAWERREDFANNVTDSVAFSTSWYSVTGTADDWMWTPAITLTSNCLLSWNALAYDPSFADGYEVRIMVAPNAPSGGTGVIGNQVTNSILLFSIAAENSTWTSRSVNLSSYSGQTVYIAFRNNSTDQFLLLIDDVKVEQIVDYDAAVVAIDTNEYTQIPIAQSPAFPFQATVTNSGANGLTGVTLHVSVFDSGNSSVYSGASPSVALAPGASTTLNVSPFLPAFADSFLCVYYVTTNEADEISANDTLFRYVMVSDTVYSRDNGVMATTLGIGNGTGGYIGQMFNVTASDTLTSITVAFNQGYLGEPYAMAVWSMSNGLPDQIIALTDTFYYTSVAAGVYTLPLTDLTILQSGQYVVTAIEFDSTLSLVTTSDIFKPGTVWVNWPGNPLVGWSNVEDFGSSFEHSIYLRANFGSRCHAVQFVQDTMLCYGESLTVGNNVYTVSGTYVDTLLNGECDSIVTTNLIISSQINAHAVLSVDQLTIMADSVVGATYEWLDCTDNSIVSGESTNILNIPTEGGTFAVIVFVGNCSDTSDCIIANPENNGIDELALKDYGFVVYPVPSNTNIYIYSDVKGTFEIMNSLGQKIKSIEILPNQTKIIDVSVFSSGWYIVHNIDTGLTQKIIIK